MVDEKAKNILFATYWKNGWIDERNRVVSDADFAYAKSKGVMFDPLTLTEHDFHSAAAAVFARTPMKKVTDAFLLSLEGKPLEWRSVLGSYAHLQAVLAAEDADEYFYDLEACNVNVLNFERLKWGGVRIGRTHYNYFDLMLFEKESVPEPKPMHVEYMRQILATIQASDAGDTPVDLRKRLKSVIKPAGALDCLIEILACAGILEPQDFDRPEPGRHDWEFALYWRGEDRYNARAVEAWFGSYGIA